MYADNITSGQLGCAMVNNPEAKRSETITSSIIARLERILSLGNEALTHNDSLNNRLTGSPATCKPPMPPSPERSGNLGRIDDLLDTICRNSEAILEAHMKLASLA